MIEQEGIASLLGICSTHLGHRWKYLVDTTDSSSLPFTLSQEEFISQNFKKKLMELLEWNSYNME